MLEIVSTNAVKPGERFDYWRDEVSRTFVHGRLEQSCDRPFYGHIKSRWYGSVLVSDITSEAQTVMRGAREIARSPQPYWLFIVQTAGTGLVAQQGREAVLHPGDVALIDTLRPYRFHFGDAFRQLCVMAPHHSLVAATKQPWSENLSLFAGRRIRHETVLGKLCRNFIATLCADDDATPSEESAVIANTMVDLIGLAVTSSSGQVTGLVQRSHGPLERAQAFICRNYADEDLSPAIAAAELGYSLRKLYKLFHDSGTTFSRYLAGIRLLNAAEELTRARGAVRISDIAFRTGFRDLSHFCRMFKARFGQTPRDYRAARRDADRFRK